jgi:MFS family permease
VGDGIGNVALVIYVQQLRGTGTAVGVLLLVTMLPSVFAPITGVVTDRFDRRLVLLGCEVSQAVAGLVIVVWLPDLAPLLLLVFAKSIGGTIADTTGRTALPALVDGAELTRANAWIGGSRQAADVLGPLLGGVLVAVGDVRTALAVDALTFVLAIPLLLRLPTLEPGTDEAGGGWLSDAIAGLRYLVHNRTARALAIGFLVLGLTAGDDVALPFLARELGSGDVGIGVLYAAVAFGLVVGFALLALRKVELAPAAAFVGGCVVVGGGEVLTGIASSIAIAVVFQIVRGLGTAAIDTGLQTMLQRSVPPEMLGRVFANVFGAVGVTAALSVGVAGPVLDATSPGTVLVLSGIAALAAAAISATLLRARPD